MSAFAMHTPIHWFFRPQIHLMPLPTSQTTSASYVYGSNSSNIREPIPTLFFNKVRTIFSFVRNCRKACSFVDGCELGDLYRWPHRSHPQCTPCSSVHSWVCITYCCKGNLLVNELWDWIFLDPFPV